MPDITRRGAMKTAGTLMLAAAVDPSLSSSAAPAPTPVPAPAKSKRVIVVGGGIGGLACAYELVGRGHEVVVLEASRRTGGHVKTIRDPLPDGLYADVGAEHFTIPGYKEYRRYVEKFSLPVLPWNRRRNMLRQINGQWFTEEQLADRSVLKTFGFHPHEIDYIIDHGWTELETLYLDAYTAKFTDEYQPFGAGLDDLDRVMFGDVLAKAGASPAALRFCGGSQSRPGVPPKLSDVSALYRIWQAAILRLRGSPVFKRDVFHLKGGNQLLTDTFTEKLGDRIRKHCPVRKIEHNEASVIVHFTENGKPQQISGDYLAICLNPLLLAGIEVAPGWPESKAFALRHTTMGMQSRVLLQAKTRFWKGDLTSINLSPEEPLLRNIWQTAEDVPGERCVLMSSGKPAQSAEESLAAFRKLYPGKHADTIEQVIVHEWPREEPTCYFCERLGFPFGQLPKMWTALIEPVGRIHFAGACYDHTPHGQDAATTSANRVAAAIHAA